MPRKKKIQYSKKLCCFDIETTHEVIDGNDVLYTWHLQAVAGTCPDDFTYKSFNTWDTFYDWLVDENDSQMLICYVHNLSYEFEAIIRNPCGHVISDIFATDTHKVLKFTLDESIEFRCSYYLTNKSLAQCGNDVNILKLDMDYDKIRHPDDMISGEDELYCAFDVIIMYHKIRQLEKQEGLSFWDFPLTNTGFLRNELRKAMSKNKHNRYLFRKSRMDCDLFLLCRECFSGGYTHANYLYTGKIVENVDSFDFGSAYPFGMLAHKFPMKSWHRVDRATGKDVKYMMDRNDVLFICRVVLSGDSGTKVVCKCANTYISFNKCKTTEDVILDNGRVQSATTIELCCTSLDLKIIYQVYDFKKIAVISLFWAEADYLPKEYIDLMLKYYDDKQALKGIPGQENNYMKAKNRVNSFYGMSVTSPLHDEIFIDGVDWEKKRIDYNNKEIVNEKLNEFYESWNSFLPYQWGVFVPAWTRFHLWNDIIIPNDKRIVYCDTDSAKVIDMDECLPSINKYNKWVSDVKKERFSSLGIEKEYPDLGYFDHETDTKHGGAYVGFKTLGAKKYLIQKADGKFYMTVSGLSKKAVEYINSFDDFRPGTIFDAGVSGRTVSHCITNQVETYDNGGCWIENTTYRISYSDSYETLLSERDGITKDEFRTDNSDLLITKNGRYSMQKILEGEEKINIGVIRDKRNLYGLVKL